MKTIPDIFRLIENLSNMNMEEPNILINAYRATVVSVNFERTIVISTVCSVDLEDKEKYKESNNHQPKCKADFNCTDINCQSLHSGKRTMLVFKRKESNPHTAWENRSILPPQNTYAEGYRNKLKQCRYGSRCVNKSTCRYYHAPPSPNKYKWRREENAQ